MAGAPHKQGLDFIPLDVDFFDDEKIQLLQDEIPDRGLRFYLHFLCFVGKKSNYIKWDALTRISFCKKFNVEKEETERILSVMIELDLFNKHLFGKYHVITGTGMQKRYLLATHRRQFAIFISEYLLIRIDDYKKNKHAIVNDIEGNLVKNYRTQAPKPKEKTKSTAAVVPIKEPVLQNTPEKKLFTHQDLIEFISVPYSKRTDEFKTKWTEESYQKYIDLNKLIDKEYSPLRISDLQLTLPEYKKLLIEIKPTEEELSTAFLKLTSTGISAKNSIFHRLKDFIVNYIRKDAAKEAETKGSGMNGQVLSPGMGKKLVHDDRKKEGDGRV